MHRTLILTVLCLMPACRPAERSVAAILTECGLEMAGEFVLGAPVAKDWIPAQIRPLKEVVQGRTYALVARAPFMHEYFAERVLPSALVQEGFTGFKKSAYMYLYIGGPTYQVSFQRKSVSYKIVVRYQPSVSLDRSILPEIFLLDVR
jgi:hypothetical protein